MKHLLYGCALYAVLTCSAYAVPLVTFGQTAQVNDVTLTDTGGLSTVISAVDVGISITQIFGGGTPLAFFDLNAHSVGPATPLGAGAQQNYAGSFSITSLAGGGGTNFLSGTFTDIAIGLNQILLVGSSDPPDTIVFTSDVIPASELNAPRGIALSLTNFSPPLTIDGSTIASGTAIISGDFNASAIPEPMSLGAIGIGMAALGYIRNRKRIA